LFVNLCGNGQVDPGEECDDDGNECCDARCAFRAADVACGQPSEGECDRQDTCDGVGTCRQNRTPAGTKCGNEPAGKRGACDPGSVCDGADVACVLSSADSGCDVVVDDVAPPEGTTLDCFAPDTGGPKTHCTMTGVEAPSGAAVTASGAARKARPVIKKQKATFASVSADGRRRKTLVLVLNKRGRKLLAQRGEVMVDLTVAIRNGDRRTPARTVRRLVSFRK
jgi:hypothetical protein